MPPGFWASALPEIPNRTKSDTSAALPRAQSAIDVPFPIAAVFPRAGGIEADFAGQGKPGFGGMQHLPLAGVGVARLRNAPIRSPAMYLARFCYDVLPVNRQRAIDF